MRHSRFNPFLMVLIALLGLTTPLSGLLRAEAYDGYTLYSPNNSRYTYLLDMSGALAHSWSHSISGGYSVYLLENTNILRTANATNYVFTGGGAAGIVQEVDWAGNVDWSYTYSSSTYLAHHDIEPMPNGNVLMIAWELKTATQTLQAGLNRNAALWPDHIIEVQPSGTTGGTIVWQWHAWDHLIQDYNASKDNYGVVADHPELLDINAGSGEVPMGGGDWMHINGISYNPTLDQIAITSHNLDEVYVIDHSTTTAEAASHSGGTYGKGGDFLYRWGNPSNYDISGNHYFNVVHCPFWIPEDCPGAGHLLNFNNREGTNASIVAEIILPSDGSGNYTWTPGTAYGPSAPSWTYAASGFYSNHLGGCQRLPNGNTLIIESTSGYIFEVDSLGSTQWSFSSGYEVARALRYATTYPGVDSLETSTEYICGDANADSKINLKDVSYVINFLYRGGATPIPDKYIVDVNGDSKVNLLDISYTINYLYRGGPDPNCP